MIKKNFLLKTVLNLSLCVIFLGISPVHTMQGGDEFKTAGDGQDGTGAEHHVPDSFLQGVTKDFADFWSSIKSGAASGVSTIASYISGEPLCSCCGKNTSPDATFTTECGHTFHPECLTKWLGYQPACPACNLLLTELYIK